MLLACFFSLNGIIQMGYTTKDIKKNKTYIDYRKAISARKKTLKTSGRKSVLVGVANAHNIKIHGSGRSILRRKKTKGKKVASGVYFKKKK